MWQETNLSNLSKEQLIAKIDEIAHERDQARSNVMQTVEHGRELLIRISQLTATLEQYKEVEEQNAVAKWTIEQLQKTNAKYSAELIELKVKLEIYDASMVASQAEIKDISHENTELKRQIQRLQDVIKKHEQTICQNLTQAKAAESAEVTAAGSEQEHSRPDSQQSDETAVSTDGAEQIAVEDLLAQLQNANKEIDELKLLLAASQKNVPDYPMMRSISQSTRLPLPQDDYYSLAGFPSPTLTPRLTFYTKDIQTETPYVDPQQITALQQEVVQVRKELAEMAARYSTAKLQAELELRQTKTRLEQVIAERDMALSDALTEISRLNLKVDTTQQALLQVEIVLLEKQRAYERDLALERKNIAQLKTDLLRAQQDLIAEQTRVANINTTQYTTVLTKNLEDFKARLRSDLERAQQGKAITILNGLV